MAAPQRTDPLTLYVDAFWMSHFDCVCYVTLREKNLPFGVGTALVREGHLHDEVLRHTITGRVPALQHGAFWLSESLAIVEYLDDAFGPPSWPRIFPAQAHERARARQIMSWLRTSLAALRRERPTQLIFYPMELKPLGADAAREADQLVRVTQRLLDGGRLTLFEEWSIADLDLTFMVMRLLVSGYDLPPPVRAFAEATWRRPAVRQYALHSRPPHPPL